MADKGTSQMTGDIDAFTEAVRTEFAFLESRCGFRRNDLQPSVSIRYETDAHYVSIALDRRQEVQMQFGRRGVEDIVDGYSFETGDLIQLECAKTWHWVSEPGPVHWVSQLAGLLEGCIAAGLFDTPSVLEAMKNRRNDEIAAWHRDERERPIRLKAAAAWDEKNYKAVAEALSDIKPSLTESEARRLRYSLKHR